jgi:hypothetical protein
MRRFDGSLARRLDFDDRTIANPPSRERGANPSAVRLRLGLGLVRGADKYAALEKRRRAAQIDARHALDLIDLTEQSAKGR